MNLLKREHAPITPEAWERIDAAARAALRTSLKARQVVDVSEPRGWEYSALGLGRMRLVSESPVEGLEYGVRTIQPLVETRTRFDLDLWDLDDFSRGAVDVDLGPVEEAARRAASFEDRAVFLGLEDPGMAGLIRAESHRPIPLEHQPERFLDAVSSAILELRRASVDGPYALAAGADSFLFLASSSAAYPLMKRLQSLVGGPILESDLLTGALLISMRGGDFLLALGQDFSLGYESHENRRVRLYIAESFTFRILDPRAVVRLERAG